MGKDLFRCVSSRSTLNALNALNSVNSVNRLPAQRSFRWRHIGFGVNSQSTTLSLYLIALGLNTYYIDYIDYMYDPRANGDCSYTLTLI